MKSKKKDWEKEIGEIVEGVFYHGMKTPKLSYNLPKGQLTEAEAVEKIQNLISSERKKAGQEGYWEGIKVMEKEYDRVLKACQKNMEHNILLERKKILKDYKDKENV